MNNAQYTINEEEKPKEVQSRERQSQLVRLIEAIEGVTETHDWKTLKTEIFDPLVETLERKIKIEAKAKEINAAELYRLQGQLGWANKYSDLQKLANLFKVELKKLKQTNGK